MAVWLGGMIWKGISTLLLSPIQHWWDAECTLLVLCCWCWCWWCLAVHYISCISVVHWHVCKCDGDSWLIGVGGDSLQHSTMIFKNNQEQQHSTIMCFTTFTPRPPPTRPRGKKKSTTYHHQSLSTDQENWWLGTACCSAFSRFRDVTTAVLWQLVVLVTMVWWVLVVLVLLMLVLLVLVALYY